MAASRAAQASSASPGQGQRTARFYYASFEARVASAILDGLVCLIIAALLTAVGSLIILISSDFERVDPSETAINLFWGCVGAIVPAILLYLFISLSWKGQTVGKSVMNVMVIRSDGRPLGVLGTVGRIIGLLIYPLFLGAGGIGAYAFREDMMPAAAIIGFAVLLCALGFLWAAFDSHRRTLHDRIAGTIVVRVG
ncbi:MAG: RDD family protein [Dehalococcoidia bacterium]|nr:RDD family protein [Dehalococcoidia bacterium]